MTVEMTHSSVPVGDATLHVVEAGPPAGDAVVLLHGWPQDWSAWTPVMELGAADGYRMVAMDLPGIGGSSIPSPRGNKDYLAEIVNGYLSGARLRNVTLVGHDAGGMTTYAYLRTFGDIARAVVLDTVVPGVEPWNAVLANPYIWHFAFHSIPDLPETLVSENIPEYFDFFYDAIAANTSSITQQARARYVTAYSSPAALSQGFEFYRAFPADADANSAHTTAIATPLLYLRGSAEGGDIAEYARGFRTAGVQTLHTQLIDGSGHFAPEEAPDAVWKAIAQFISTTAEPSTTGPA